jgi:8-oxo-dGTP diphosphatase
VKYRITVDLSKQKVIKPNNLEAGKMKKSVSLVIVFNNSDEVLLARRKHDPYKGEWSVPGGHVEKNESLLSAAIREIKEETNLSVKKPKLVYSTIEGNTFVYVFIAKTNNSDKIK